MTHGIEPLEYHVLLKVDEVEDTITTKSGVTLYKGYAENSDRVREEAKNENATIVALAVNAFEDWAVKPIVGDRIKIPPFGGEITFGEDGEKYRLCKDSVIKARIRS
jgi:co-chaperonin GroES (HSP10)